jgi:DNA-binding IclR family transcriptional regulator
VELLGGFDETCLFTLAAVVTHENVTLSEAAAVTRYPEGLCHIHLDRLTELGVLRVDKDRYRVTTYWHRAAVRLLRRRNLLMD